MANDWFENLLSTDDELDFEDDPLWDFEEFGLCLRLMMITSSFDNQEQAEFLHWMSQWSMGVAFVPSDKIKRRVLDQMGKLGFMRKMKWYFKK